MEVEEKKTRLDTERLRREAVERDHDYLGGEVGSPDRNQGPRQWANNPVLTLYPGPVQVLFRPPGAYNASPMNPGGERENGN